MRLHKPNIQIIKADGERLTFSFCSRVSITTNFKDLTDKATCVLPARVRINDSNETVVLGETELIQRGDRIKIAYGYYPKRFLEFDGYVAGIAYSRPFVIHCEDKSWLLKNRIIPYWKEENTTLESVGKRILQEIEDPSLLGLEVLDAKIGDFEIINATPAQVLDELKSTYGLDSYIFGDKLNIGFQSPPKYEPITHNFYFDNTGEKKYGVIAESLKWIEADDIRIKLRLVCINDDNTKTEVNGGDENGDLKTFYFANVEPDSKEKRVAYMKSQADEYYKKYKFSGMQGEITVFGYPPVKHGDNVRLHSRSVIRRRGVYVVEGVSKTFSSGGIRQRIKLGARIGGYGTGGFQEVNT